MFWVGGVNNFEFESKISYQRMYKYIINLILKQDQLEFMLKLPLLFFLT